MEMLPWHHKHTILRCLMILPQYRCKNLILINFTSRNFDFIVQKETLPHLVTIKFLKKTGFNNQNFSYSKQSHVIKDIHPKNMFLDFFFLIALLHANPLRFR